MNVAVVDNNNSELVNELRNEITVLEVPVNGRKNKQRRPIKWFD